MAKAAVNQHNESEKRERETENRNGSAKVPEKKEVTTTAESAVVCADNAEVRQCGAEQKKQKKPCERHRNDGRSVLLSVQKPTSRTGCTKQNKKTNTRISRRGEGELGTKKKTLAPPSQPA